MELHVDGGVVDVDDDDDDPDLSCLDPCRLLLLLLPLHLLHPDCNLSFVVVVVVIYIDGIHCIKW